MYLPLQKLSNGLHNLKFNLPYYSQYMNPEIGYQIFKGELNIEDDLNWNKFGSQDVSDYIFWSKRSCAIACLRMVLNGFGNSIKNNYELVKQGLELGGYLINDINGNFVDKGWYHIPLIHLARTYGIDGLIKNCSNINDLCESIILSQPIMASVSVNICDSLCSDASKNGHFIVIHGFKWSKRNKCTHILFHNPLGKNTKTSKNVLMNVEEFKNYFSGRIILFWKICENFSLKKATIPNSDVNDNETLRGGISTIKLSNNVDLYQNDLLKYQKQIIQSRSEKNIESEAWQTRDLAETYRRLGDYTNALRQFRRCQKLFAEINNYSGIAWSLWGIASVQRILSQYDDAILHYHKSKDTFQKADDALGIAAADSGLAEIERVSGNILKSLSEHYKLADRFTNLSEIRGQVWAYTGMAQIACMTGIYNLAIFGFLKALKLSKNLGYNVGACWAILGLSSIAKITFNYNYALKTSMHAKKELEATGYKVGILYAHLHHADILRSLGQYEDAIELSKNTLKEFQKLEKSRGIAYAQLGIASNYRMINEFELAKELYLDSLDIFQNSNIRNGILRSKLGVAEVYRYKRQFAKSLAYYKEVLSESSSWGYRIESTHAQMGINAIEVELNNKPVHSYDNIIDEYLNLGFAWGVVHGYIQKAISASNSENFDKLLNSAELASNQLNYKRGLSLIKLLRIGKSKTYSFDYP